MTTTVLIVDDEAASRSLIRNYLADHADFSVVGESVNGLEAVEMVNTLVPDLVFMDVQMPGKNGLEVLTEVQHVPIVIFSTAYDKYALRAFDLHAVDYLLKPYTKKRFDIALRKAAERTPIDIAPLIEHQQKALAASDRRMVVSLGTRFRSIVVSDILCVTAYGDYSKINDGHHSYLSKKGISILEAILDPQLFLRIHRSTIINMSAIREVRRYKQSYLVIMNDNREFRVSRGYADRVRELIL